MRSTWRDGDRTRDVEVEAQGGGRYRVTVDGAPIELTVEVLGDDRLQLTAEGSTAVAELSAAGTRRFVRLGLLDFVIEREAGSRGRGGRAHGAGLEAPMPGVVTRVMVAPGEQVTKGQPLVAIEAMKMEHLVRAPRDGRIKSIAVRASEMVNGGVPVVEMDEPEA